MNLSIPIILSETNEEFRLIVRDMLMKHGFFHIIEASNQEETLISINNLKSNYFLIAEAGILNDLIINNLKGNQFIVLSNANEDQLMTLAVRLGVNHFLNFPFSSDVLIKKMEQFL